MKEIVVVTGCSAGLGRAIAHAFAKRGASLGLMSRNKERLAQVKREVEELGGSAIVLPLDVANYEQIKEAAIRVENELGPIDIWINNAMVSVYSPAQQMEAHEFKRVTEVTYLGYVYGTLEALKYMTPRDKGVIIQVGSALAYRGIPLQSAYCAAKHAIQGFTESVRSELIHDKSNVKISMIQLPAMNTPQFTWTKSRLKRKPRPLPPVFQPEVVADAIVWAAYHYRREWTFGFMTKVVITGDKWFSAFGDKYLAGSYDSQEYNGLADPNRRDNLYDSVPGDFKAHGDFDNEAASHSFYTWLSQRRKEVTLTVVLIIVAICFGLFF